MENIGAIGEGKGYFGRFYGDVVGLMCSGNISSVCVELVDRKENVERLPEL